MEEDKKKINGLIEMLEEVKEDIVTFQETHLENLGDLREKSSDFADFYMVQFIKKFGAESALYAEKTFNKPVTEKLKEAYQILE